MPGYIPQSALTNDHLFLLEDSFIQHTPPAAATRFCEFLVIQWMILISISDWLKTGSIPQRCLKKSSGMLD